MEKSVMEEERDKIRELHQRQQDSIKSLQALESRFCGVAIDDVETFQGSSNASRVPTLELMAKAQTMKLPPLEKDIESQTNTVTIDISATDDSDTSDSDATMTDEDDEHISREELSKAAKHVTKLLRRIIVLQKSLENDQKPHQKRRVRKIYQRFCRKFESGINVTQAMGPSRYGSPATRSSNQYNHALGLGDMGGGALENFDFDSFLHVRSESTLFPVVPQQQQPMSPLPPRQHLNEPQPEVVQSHSNHIVPNMNSEAVSSSNAAMMHFLVRSKDVEQASLAATVSSRRRSESGISIRVAPGVIKPKLRKSKEQHRPSSLENILPKRTPSNLLLKRKGGIPVQQSDTALDKSEVPIIEKPKRISGWGRPESRPIVSDAVRQRNPHAQETPSIPNDTRTLVVHPPSDDKPEQEADRPRDNKIRRTRSTLDVGLEGAYSTSLQREKKRKQIFEIEEPFDPGNRDVVDVLLERWTVPEH
jgi:hypothetical protein